MSSTPVLMAAFAVDLALAVIVPHRPTTTLAPHATPRATASCCSAPAAVERSRIVYVRNVAWEASTRDLRRVCESFGAVDEAWLAPDRRGINHAGWGKVVFSAPAAAEAAVAAWDVTLHGRDVAVGLSDPAKERDRKRRALPRRRRFL